MSRNRPFVAAARASAVCLFCVAAAFNVRASTAQLSLTRLPSSSNADLFVFGPRDPRIPARFGSSRILWQFRVNLPRGSHIRDVVPASWAPIFRPMDGRCFATQFHTSGEQLNAVTITQSCPKGELPLGAEPSVVPAPGLQYRGRVWTMNMWTEQATGVTTLYTNVEGRNVPILSAKVAVLSAGGMGSPDTPQTELSLVCIVRHQLRMVTFNLITS